MADLKGIADSVLTQGSEHRIGMAKVSSKKNTKADTAMIKLREEAEKMLHSSSRK